MIVPTFWAEAKLKARVGKRQTTLRRFGWSDVSQEEAQAKAEARAQEALSRITSGEKLPRHEPRMPYNGADGIPIREEILSRHGETVITRNGYGAHCLNTPDVLFADVDFEEKTSLEQTYLAGAILGIATIFCGGIFEQWGIGVICGILIAVLWCTIGILLQKARRRANGTPEQQAQKRIAQFVQDHPTWHLRVYRTPAGFRLLAMHQTFDPVENAVTKFFTALNTDPIYVRMCQKQNCFRARVSPKFWRVGIKKHLPGKWPTKSEHVADRAAWIKSYEEASRHFASCSFVEALGSITRVDAKAKTIQLLHDQLCGASTGRPIA